MAIGDGRKTKQGAWGGRYYGLEENRIGWSGMVSLRRGCLSRDGKEGVTSLDVGKAFQAEGTAGAQALRREGKRKSKEPVVEVSSPTAPLEGATCQCSLSSTARISGNCFLPRLFSDLGTNVRKSNFWIKGFVEFKW